MAFPFFTDGVIAFGTVVVVTAGIVVVTAGTVVVVAVGTVVVGTATGVTAMEEADVLEEPPALLAIAANV